MDDLSKQYETPREGMKYNKNSKDKLTFEKPLSPEKRVFLLDDLSKQYEVGRRGRTKEERVEKDNMSSPTEDG